MGVYEYLEGRRVRCANCFEFVTLHRVEPRSAADGSNSGHPALGSAPPANPAKPGHG